MPCDMSFSDLLHSAWQSLGPSTSLFVAVVQSLRRVWLFATPRTAARRASLSVTNSWSLLKVKSIELVMPSNHLILCHPFLLPSTFPNIRVFSNGSSHQVAKALELQQAANGHYFILFILTHSYRSWTPPERGVRLAPQRRVRHLVGSHWPLEMALRLCLQDRELTAALSWQQEALCRPQTSSLPSFAKKMKRRKGRQCLKKKKAPVTLSKS